MSGHRLDRFVVNIFVCMSVLCCVRVDRRRLKRLMQTFPSTPSLESNQSTRMLRDSSGISVDDASVDVRHLALHSCHDVVSDQQRLSAELSERIQQLTAERQEAWAPLDLATIVQRSVPLSTRASGLFIFYSCS